MAGTYEVTNSQGAVLQSRLHEDGTYTDTTDGEVVETGTWTEEGNQVCFTPEMQQQAQPQEYCYAISETGESGVFEATSTEGETTTVTKVG